MDQTMPHRTLAILTALSLAHTCHPAAHAAASALGYARYDPAHQAIVVPYTGVFPRYTTGTMLHPPAIYLDFENAAHRDEPTGGQVTGHALITRWVMAPRQNGQVRLTLMLSAPGVLEVRHDPARHAIIVSVFQARTSAVAPRNMPFPTAPPSPSLPASILGVPRYEPEREAVVVPYIGTFPRYTTRTLTGPDRIRFDFAAEATLSRSHAATVTRHPLLRRWTMEAPEPGLIRVTLFLERPAAIHIYNDSVDQEVWLSFRENPAAPTATPAAEAR